MIYSITNLLGAKVSVYKEGKMLGLVTEYKETLESEMKLSEEQLHDLIGALHIIKNKIAKEVTDAK
jgi:hypothetical protein